MANGIDPRRVFRDANGKEWTVCVDGYVLSEARRDGVNLTDLFSGGIPDMGTLLELAWFGVQHMSEFSKGKAAMRKIDFLKMLTGKTLAAATVAVAAALETCFALDGDDDEGDGDADEGNSDPLV